MFLVDGIHMLADVVITDPTQVALALHIHYLRGQVQHW